MIRTFSGSESKVVWSPGYTIPNETRRGPAAGSGSQSKPHVSISCTCLPVDIIGGRLTVRIAGAFGKDTLDQPFNDHVAHFV
jgi:hypothetical protein